MGKTPRPTWQKTPRPTKKMDWPSKKMTEEPTKYSHGQWQKDQMKKTADAAYYRDPYERRYSMRYSEPDHDDYKPTEPKYGDNHWQKTPRPTKWKMEKTPKPTWAKTPKPTKEY